MNVDLVGVGGFKGFEVLLGEEGKALSEEQRKDFSEKVQEILSSVTVPQSLANWRRENGPFYVGRVRNSPSSESLFRIRPSFSRLLLDQHQRGFPSTQLLNKQKLSTADKEVQDSLLSPSDSVEELEKGVRENDQKSSLEKPVCSCAHNSWKKPFYYRDMDLCREMEFVVAGDESPIESFSLLGYKDDSVSLCVEFKDEEAYRTVYKKLRNQVGMPLPTCIIANHPIVFSHPAGMRAMIALLEEDLSFYPEEKSNWDHALQDLPPESSSQTMLAPLSSSLPYDGFVKSRLLPLRAELPLSRPYMTRGVEAFELTTTDPQSSVSEVTLLRDGSRDFRIWIRMSSMKEYQNLRGYLAREGIERDSYGSQNTWRASSKRELAKGLAFLLNHCELRERDALFLIQLFQRAELEVPPMATELLLGGEEPSNSKGSEDLKEEVLEEVKEEVKEEVQEEKGVAS